MAAGDQKTFVTACCAWANEAFEVAGIFKSDDVVGASADLAPAYGRRAKPD